MKAFFNNQFKSLKEIPGKKMLLENFLSLSALQATNYILPLITVPYLVRVLGPEKFGLIAFAQAFITYFAIITDYGFNLSATRQIAIHREDKNKIAEIFSAVMLIKAIIGAISLIILIILISTISKFKADRQIYLLTFGMVAGCILFPVWFFQGMEKMKYIAFLNVLAKIIFTISIFIFIRRQSDYAYVPLINSIGLIVAGLLSMWIVHKDFKIQFKSASIEEIKRQLKEGWQIFISYLATTLHTISTSFILGLLTNNTIVGYYSAGEKIIIPVTNLMSPFTQAVFPRISNLAGQSREKALQLIGQLGSIASAFVLLACLMIFIFAEKITLIILGNQFHESIVVMRILSFCPLATILSNIFGIQIMIPFNMLSERTKVLIFSGILNLILLVILVPPLKHIGAAISLMTTATAVTAGLLFYLIRCKFTLARDSTELA
jgi:PST family polysaccharide transporter